MIPGWVIAIKPYSKWWPSAILNFRNLVFWSCIRIHDQNTNVILLYPTKFRVNPIITRSDIAKRRFWICCDVKIISQFKHSVNWITLTLSDRVGLPGQKASVSGWITGQRFRPGSISELEICCCIVHTLHIVTSSYVMTSGNVLREASVSAEVIVCVCTVSAA